MRSKHVSDKKDVHILLGKIRNEFVCALVVNGEVVYQNTPCQELSYFSVHFAAVEVALHIDILELGDNWNIHNGVFHPDCADDHHSCTMIDTMLLHHFSMHLLTSCTRAESVGVVALIRKKVTKPVGVRSGMLRDRVAPESMRS